MLPLVGNVYICHLALYVVKIGLDLDVVRNSLWSIEFTDWHSDRPLSKHPSNLTWAYVSSHTM